jgi:hypothetical protein
MREVIAHILKRGVKLEQEGIEHEPIFIETAQVRP